MSVGGTVVYATCSLSPVQNDGVVQVALKKVWEETDTVMIVKFVFCVIFFERCSYYLYPSFKLYDHFFRDMSEALLPLGYLFQFANVGLKYGHIAVPTMENNWGPMYFCKIQRVR